MMVPSPECGEGRGTKTERPSFKGRVILNILIKTISMLVTSDNFSSALNYMS
jgi:hypothetical protein